MANRFDQLAKLMTRDGLAPAGAVETDAEVIPASRHVDVSFTPDPALAPALDRLGMLGRMAIVACTFEPFHDTPTSLEVMGCVCKHHLFRELLARRAPAPSLPVQWIVSSGTPTSALRDHRFSRARRWGPGVYDAPPAAFTRLVAVSELPRNRDTLLMRLMGAGSVLAGAIEDLKNLPQDAYERTLAQPIVLRLRLEVPADPARRGREDEEFIMSTQDIVAKYLEETRMEGRQEGRYQGYAEAILGMYRTRFGEPPRDVAAAIQAARDLPALEGWLQLVATRSAEDIAAAIRAF